MSLPQRPIVAVSLVAAYATFFYSRWQITTQPEASITPSIFTLVSTFIIAYFIQVIAYAVYAIVIYPHFFSPLRHLPQPTSNHFLFGQFPRIIKEPTGRPALDWINTIPNDGLIRYLGIFNQERLLITKPKALAEVLVSRNYDFEKPQVVRQTLEKLLGVGILLAEGDEHKFQRKTLSPAFAFRHVKDLYPVFWDKGRESVLGMQALVMAQVQEQLKAETNGETSAATSVKAGALEMNSWSTRTALDIIGIAGLGHDFGALQDSNHELVAHYNVMLHPKKGVRLLPMLGLVFPRWLLDMLPLRRNTEIETANVYIKQVCRDLISEKRLFLERKKESGSNDKKELDILSVALESGGFSDENLVSQLMTFLVAGHETTSAALIWAIYQLCCNPAIQDRLRKEIRENLPSLDGRSPSSAEIDQLPYLNAVCSEVLRYMAPVPSTVREARIDTTIQGQHVPRGTMIMMVPWAVNRSIDLWGPTATQFNPDRWLSGETHMQSNYRFLTFLHGPRSCIGTGFARAEFACVLATWVGRFEFRIQNPADLDEKSLEIQGNVSSRPKKGLNVYARILDGW